MVVEVGERIRPTRVVLVVLKEPFLCVLGETDQNTLLCNAILPANHSDVLLKRKQAYDCLALQTAIELSDGRNDVVTSSRQNNNKIIKRNSDKVCCLALQNNTAL